LPPRTAVDRRLSNRSVRRLILGAMALMALLGLSYALWTMDFRNRNHQRLRVVQVNKEPAEAITRLPMAPGDLPALGYLPGNTNVVGAVHVAEILQDAVGRKLLQQPRPVPLEAALASVEQWTGLKPESIDHLVFGTRIGTDVPPVWLVVRTRMPYDQAAIAAARLVQGAKTEEYRHKALYSLRIAPVNGFLWCADEQTLVLLVRLDGTWRDDLNALPETPRRGAEGLPSSLRNVLEKRLGKGTLVWLAGHLDQPDILGPVLTLSQVPPEVQQLVTSIQTFAAGLRFPQKITLTASFHGSDAQAARHLEEYLRRQTGPIPAFKVARSPSPLAHPEVCEIGAIAGGLSLEARPLATTTTLAAVLALAVRSVPNDEANWVTLQVRADADYIRQTLNNMSAFMPRVLRP